MGLKLPSLLKIFKKLIDESEVENNLRAPGDYFDAYRSTDEVNAWINDLKEQFPDLITIEEIGKTYQGKSINAVHLISNKGTDKPRIVYNSCQHAREWITVPTISWVLNALVTNYGKNDTLSGLVDAIDWTFIPITNIDGYDYSRSSDRLWRKTRKPNPGTSCVGVDPNRNWEYMWNRGGSSSQPCSDIYHGPSAGSEPEPKAVADFIKNTPRVAGYMDIHSYSQLFMSPWGYSSSYPPDYSKMQAVMNPLVAEMREVHGRSYRSGSIGSILYIASGNAVDYAYGSLKILHSYTIELRDTGQYGFILPANQIIPQGEEFLEGVIIMANAVKTQFYSERK